ncbi:MAG: cell wall metabolism sensor histidine kinase WalK [Clostridiales bacterium]|nr:cell wall metabolism sensor histidine kinase WalK [Clostridiales bacterium]
MFKSIFSKYITVFMLIIVISFVALVGIITSTVNRYSASAKSEMVEGTARSVALYLEDRLTHTGLSDFSSYIILNEPDISAVMRVITANSNDITILVTDTAGNIIYYTDSAVSRVNTGVSIPKTLMDELMTGVEISQLDYLEGVFDRRHMIYAVPVYNSNNYICGAVFVCSASVTLSDLLEAMIKTILVASLWIMIAALIAVYFVSEMVIGPLKNMSRAAKSFAAGRFDVRVPVKGSDEVAELAVAFNNMAESLANLENMRNTFMANVSHDLRTPMTTIAGFIDGILAGAIPPDKHEYYLGIIASEVRRLSRLVASLLDISRMQAGDRKFSMSRFDICEMARQILISFEQKIDAKHLEVEFECENEYMTVKADRDAIYQILYNICDNAVKFSREGGVLRITIMRYKEKKLLISVFNEGQGIPPEDVPFVFERFYKSDKSRGLDKTGVGLGLFIAKTIIQAHNQDIWVKSNYGKNCEFCFTLEEDTTPSGH